MENSFDSRDTLRAIRTGDWSGALKQPLGEREQTCESHGKYISVGNKYMDRIEVWSKCQGCEEERIAKQEREATLLRIEQRKAAMAYAIGQAAIPARFIGRSFDNFNAQSKEQTAALTTSRDYAENFEERRKKGESLIFSGKPGTGKSHLAIAILQSLMPGEIGLYVTCMDVIRMVRATWRRDSEKSEEQVLEMLASVPLLVVDEIGVQYGTDGEQTILFDVMDRRYREMMPCVLLTNQNTKGFKDFVGERTYDRLREVSQWVPFDWESYRPTARDQ